MSRRENNKKLPNCIVKSDQSDESYKHDVWFREQVTIGLIEADSPEAVRAKMKQRAKARAK
ncbi:MAG: hypothetical protein COA34_002570 [Methylophaga sp.]|uniref:hypothetical protein n=1 Tax=Methylophaga sp. TaxID=2024840 RepID=UPI000C11C054|nr:hypothetical protein [Methylophaga sp.]MBL1456736.1 hypothetical protein [Methylophaga sp.]